MSEAIPNKDPALKLFGQTIQLPHSSAGIDEGTQMDQCDDDGNDGNKPWAAAELQDQNPIPEKRDNIKESLPHNDCSTSKMAKSEEEQGETTNSQDKILKKPDKIIPCPRCNSMETKFCYFNNYNVNQPRHFCKNCQRYWTAGGNMRNMPVGSGRRKHKNSVFQYRHLTVPEASLTFDSENPLSNVSAFNVANKTMQNGFRKYEELRIPVGFEGGDNGDEHSDVSSVTAASSKDSDNKSARPDMQRHNFNNFPPHIPYYTGVPWSYPVPPPGYYLPGFPMPFYPAPSFWNVPWMYPPIASENQMPSTLGKHSRDESLLESTGSEEEPQRKSNPETCLWFPKTLRMDDPGEAAKNSIWATLGIKQDAVDSVSGGLLKAFLHKSDETDRGSENSSVLQANPAAMSRSLKFKESS